MSGGVVGAQLVRRSDGKTKNRAGLYTVLYGAAALCAELSKRSNSRIDCWVAGEERAHSIAGDAKRGEIFWQVGIRATCERGQGGNHTVRLSE